MTTPTFIDKLAFIYLRDHKILESRNHNKDTWYIPGGKREPGETDQAALMREVKEELSVDLIPETIQHYGTFQTQAHGKATGTMVRMTCYTADFTGALAATSEVAELDFFSYADIDRTSPVDQLIFKNLHTKGLIN